MNGFSIVILTLLSVFAALPAAALPPCTCVWDNSTKDYPADSKSASLFQTTVRYRCGYICADRDGHLTRVNGRHEVSFHGQEAGNEVVCDGLRYEMHSDPERKFNRWVLYFWDGITHSFSADRSASPDVRAWAEANTCRNGGAMSFDETEIDQLRTQVGLSPLTSRPPARPLAPAVLSAGWKCPVSAPQAEFLNGRGACAADQEDLLQQKLLSLSQAAFRLRTAAEAATLAQDLDTALLCPRLLRVPTPAVLRQTLLKLSAFPIALTEIACTMGLRGLPYGLLTTEARAALQ